MHAAWVMLAAATLGGDIEHNFKPLAAGGYEYQLQLEPVVLEELSEGKNISTTLPNWMHIGKFRIFLGRGPLEKPVQRESQSDDERYIESLADLPARMNLNPRQYGFEPFRTGSGYKLTLQLTKEDLESLKSNHTITRDIPEWLDAREYSIRTGNDALKQEPRKLTSDDRTTTRWTEAGDTGATGSTSDDRRRDDEFETDRSRSRSTADEAALAAERARSARERDPDSRTASTTTSRTRRSADEFLDDADRRTPTTSRTRARSDDSDFADLERSGAEEKDPPRARATTTARRPSSNAADPEPDEFSASSKPASTSRAGNRFDSRTPEEKPEHAEAAAPAGNMTAAIVALALSIVGNVYLGWVAMTQRVRYWEIVDRFRGDSDEDRPRRHREPGDRSERGERHRDRPAREEAHSSHSDE